LIQKRKNKNQPRKFSNCPINFEFSIDRIECKICSQFESCLNIFMKAYKLAKEVS